MEFIKEIIFPTLGFLLAIVGAWDKLVIGVKFFARKRTEKKLRIAQHELAELEKFNGSLSYLVAYEFKQLFSIITVLLVSILVDSAPFLDRTSDPQVLVNIYLVLSWFAGFFSGRAIRAVNYVLKREKLRDKFQRLIDGAEKKLECSQA